MRENYRLRSALSFMVVVITITIIWALYDIIVPVSGQDNTNDIKSAIVNTLSRQGIDNCESEIDGFYFYGVKYLTEEDKQLILDSVAKKLGVNTDYIYTTEMTENGSIARLQKQAANSDVVIDLITYEIEESENVISLRHYISVKMIITDSIESGIYYKDKLQNILCDVTQDNNEGETYQSDRTLSISFKGKVKGCLNLDMQKKIASDIINGIGADTVFDNISDNSYSLYGYTSDLSENVSIGKNKINVNIVFSYDETNDLTTIHLASPIANYDY